MTDTDALFIISVAARLVSMHPSTLRKYERVGFLEPSRVGGKLRLYSTGDIDRLRQIKYLVDERGVNLAGVELALDLTDNLGQLRDALRGDVDSREAQRRARWLLSRMLEALGARPDRGELVDGSG